jgi:putative peptidoglycan lipid II flippase
MTEKRRMAKSSFIVSSGIMTSRILGFIRDILIARFFGIGLFAQAFFMAFTLPNSLRQLVAEGAMDTVLVPVLTEHKVKGTKDEFWKFANILFNVCVVFLLIIVMVGVFAAPLLVRLIAPGFVNDIEKFNLTILLLRMIFPYVLLVGLTAYCMGVLHTFNHFAAPAFSSVILNIAIIAGILIVYPDANIAYVGCAVIIGGMVQFAVQMIPILRRGPFFDARAGFAHRDVQKVGRLLVPRIIGAGIYQINVIVDRILASLPLAGEGAVAALYYGNRLFHLPLALFGVSLATVALPSMSSHVVTKDIDKFKDTITFSMKNMLFFSLPASAGLIVLARPIIRILFERGEFTAYATQITSTVLLFYAFGLIAYGGAKILVAAFHSMQNTATPVKVAFFALISNIIFNLLLIVPLKVGGLALATSLSGFLNVAALYTILVRKVGTIGGKDLIVFFLKTIAATVLMTVVASWIVAAVEWGGMLNNIVGLLMTIIVSLLAYLVASVLLGIYKVERIYSWMKRR